MANFKVLKGITGAALAVSLLVGGTDLFSQPIQTATAAESTTKEATKAPSIYIAPIDRANFLAGAKFDFRVELNDLQADPGAVKILINGKEASEVFGKAYDKTSTDKSKEFTIRDVTFNEAGTYTVSVSAGSLFKSVTYNVFSADVNGKKAKNVILIIGDGMSFPEVTITRILSKGLTEGKYNGLLEMDKFDQRAVVTTSGMDSVVTDSANSASAYNTGHKSVVNGLGIYPDNTDNNSFDDPKVETLAEMLKRSRNMAVGVVTTSEIEDATPAAVVSHTRRRSDKQEIAEMLYKVQPEVVLGGGSAYFLPKSTPGSKRTDEKDIIKQFEQSGYTFADSATSMKAAPNDKLLGLFHPSDMNVYYDRSTNNKDALKSFTDQPSLPDMTQKAIDVLSKNENGFFLMVEGASVDKQLHTLDWERAAYDNIEMDKAVGVARRFADQNGETLIIVTADHAHSASVVGTYWEGDGASGREAVRTYADSKFPNYVDANNDGFPDNLDVSRKLAVVFGANPDYYDDHKFPKVPTAPAVDSKGIQVANPARLANPNDPQKDRFLVRGTVNPKVESQGVHTADDVPLMAYGAGASYFKGTMDNTDVFFGMVNALGLNLTGSKDDGKNWVKLTDFINVIGASVSHDNQTNKTTVTVNGQSVVLNLSTGQASKNKKLINLEFQTDANGQISVTSNSLLAAFN